MPSTGRPSQRPTTSHHTCLCLANHSSSLSSVGPSSPRQGWPGCLDPNTTAHRPPPVGRPSPKTPARAHTRSTPTRRASMPPHYVSLSCLSHSSITASHSPHATLSFHLLLVCLALCSLLAPAAATSSSRRLDCNPITSEFDGSHQGEAHVGSRLVLAGWLAGYDCAFFLLPGPLPPAALVINKESMVIESSTRVFSFNLTTNHVDGTK